MRAPILIALLLATPTLAQDAAPTKPDAPSKPDAEAKKPAEPETKTKASLLVREVQVAGQDGPVSLLVQDGRVTAIGRGLRAPPGTPALEGGGRRLVAGRIDAWARVLGGDPLGSALDGFDRWDRVAIEAALSRGVTTIYVAPSGKGGLLGVGSVIKLRPTGEPTVVVREAAVCASLGGPLASPLARAGLWGDLRARLERARRLQEAQAEYRDALERWLAGQPATTPSATTTTAEPAKPDESGPPRGGRGRGRRGRDVEDDLAAELPATPAGEEKKPAERPKPPQADRGLVLLGRVLDRELPLRIEAHRAEDILCALELAQELGLRVVIEGATEAGLVSDALRAQRASVVLGPPVATQGAGDYGAARFDAGAAATLARARVQAALGSGDWSATPNLDLAAALAAGAGLPRAAAAEAITTRAAEVLGVGDRLGRVAVGFEADLVLVGPDDALGASGAVEAVVVDGEVVWRRAP